MATLNPTIAAYANGLAQAFPTVPASYWYAWILSEKPANWNGSTNFANNPLNIAYPKSSPDLEGLYGFANGGMSSGPGATYIGTFPNAQAGLAGAVAYIQGNYMNIVNSASQGVASFSSTIGASGYGTGYAVANNYAQTFGSTVVQKFDVLSISSGSRGWWSDIIAPFTSIGGAAAATEQNVQTGVANVSQAVAGQFTKATGLPGWVLAIPGVNAIAGAFGTAVGAGQDVESAAQDALGSFFSTLVRYAAIGILAILAVIVLLDMFKGGNTTVVEQSPETG